MERLRGREGRKEGGGGRDEERGGREKRGMKGGFNALSRMVFILVVKFIFLKRI